MEQSVIEDVLTNKAMWHIELGDCLGVLRGMPSESVHTVITSPPYFNLRDYKTEGQIGLERTPQEFVARLVEIFREVRRVLRSDGCAWVNMGDSYAGGAGGRGGTGENGSALRQGRSHVGEGRIPRPLAGMKPKDLMGLPWRLAFALQEDGWYLRQDIIWHKPAPMPESVTDRCTKAHEYIFLLSKSPRYFYDVDAVRQPSLASSVERATNSKNGSIGEGKRADTLSYAPAFADYHLNPAGANLRSVWSIPTEPLKDAHYAAYPTRLPELCLLAGTSARGCCPECGAQWRRVVERVNESNWHERVRNGATGGSTTNGHNTTHGAGMTHDLPPRHTNTTGWQPTCTHAHEPIPSLVLDPFAGSGSTLIAALRNGRRALGIDISEEYGRIARKRLMGVTIPHPEMVCA